MFFTSVNIFFGGFSLDTWRWGSERPKSNDETLSKVETQRIPQRYKNLRSYNDWVKSSILLVNVGSFWIFQKITPLLQDVPTPVTFSHSLHLIRWLYSFLSLVKHGRCDSIYKEVFFTSPLLPIKDGSHRKNHRDSSEVHPSYLNDLKLVCSDLRYISPSFSPLWVPFIFPSVLRSWQDVNGPNGGRDKGRIVTSFCLLVPSTTTVTDWDIGVYVIPRVLESRVSWHPRSG